MNLIKRKVTPFTKVRYHTRDDEAYWAPRIKLVCDTVGPIEILMVEKGHREASTVHLRKKNYKEEIEALKSRGLIFTPIHWVKSFNGFAHEHIYSNKNDPEAICYGVATRTEKVGTAFRNASEGGQQDHDLLGGLLGYPSCCRKFFKDVWTNGYVDTIWHQALNSGAVPERAEHGGYSLTVKGYPECVAMQRYWGVRVSFHLPCSFTCEETRKLSELWYREIRSVNKRAAEVLKETLSLPTCWDAHKGVAVVNTPHYKGLTSSVTCADIHTVNYLPIQ